MPLKPALSDHLVDLLASEKVAYRFDTLEMVVGIRFKVISSPISKPINDFCTDLVI